MGGGIASRQRRLKRARVKKYYQINVVKKKIHKVFVCVQKNFGCAAGAREEKFIRNYFNVCVHIKKPAYILVWCGADL